MTYCPHCRRDSTLIPPPELLLPAVLFLLLFVVIAYQAGFDAGAASVAATLDTYVP